jgi:hypothetical protein
MLIMLNLFSCLFLMLVVDALLILNAIMHWLCSSPIALYNELRVHFMAFLKFSIGLKYSQNLNILPI